LRYWWHADKSIFLDFIMKANPRNKYYGGY